VPEQASRTAGDHLRARAINANPGPRRGLHARPRDADVAAVHVVHLEEMVRKPPPARAADEAAPVQRGRDERAGCAGGGGGRASSARRS